MRPEPPNATLLLEQLSTGDPDAMAQLVPLLYNELRQLASHYLRNERPGHTLQPTALVHEAYLRLIDWKEVEWKSRGHFLGVAAQQMRRILVDYARSHRAAKRGGPAPKFQIDEAAFFCKERAGELVEVDEALKKLAEFDVQQGRVVELRFFGGLTVEETAEVLGISPATVKREWTLARAWLSREIQRGRGRESRRVEAS